jgi:hypothetical protein
MPDHVSVFQLFDLPAILNLLRARLGRFNALIDKAQLVFGQIKTLIPRTHKLTEDIMSEFTEWHQFREGSFKHRVINVEQAIRKNEELFIGMKRSFAAVRDIIRLIKAPIRNPIEGAAEDATAFLESAEGGVARFLARFPSLARALEKVIGLFALLVDMLASYSQALNDLQTILDELKRVRLAVEKLDTIFLGQGNKRKFVKLADGKFIRIRVGRLHSGEV